MTSNEPQAERRLLSKIDWTNVLTGLLLCVLPAGVGTYAAVKVVDQKVENFETEVRGIKEWIKRVDDRGQSRRDDTLEEIHRELDAHDRDIRELRRSGRGPSE